MGFFSELFGKKKKEDPVPASGEEKERRFWQDLRKKPEDEQVNELLGQAEFLMAYGGHQSKAIELLKEAERICRKTGNQEGLKNALRNQAQLLKGQRQVDDLKKKYGIQEEESAEDLFSQALMLLNSGEYEKAMPLFATVEQMLSESGDRDGVAACLGYQATILNLRGESDKAMTLLKEQERIYQELGNDSGVKTSREMQAMLGQKKRT